MATQRGDAATVEATQRNEVEGIQRVNRDIADMYGWPKRIQEKATAKNTQHPGMMSLGTDTEATRSQTTPPKPTTATKSPGHGFAAMMKQMQSTDDGRIAHDDAQSDDSKDMFAMNATPSHNRSRNEGRDKQKATNKLSLK